MLRDITWVNDPVTEMMHAAIEEAVPVPVPELSQVPDSKMEEEVPDEASSEAGSKEEDEGIHMILSIIFMT